MNDGELGEPRGREGGRRVAGFRGPRGSMAGCMGRHTSLSILTRVYV